MFFSFGLVYGFFLGWLGSVGGCFGVRKFLGCGRVINNCVEGLGKYFRM